MKIELFGKSCVFGFLGGRFRIHCTTAERIVRVENLVFRVHPTDVRKKMARADFKNGFSVCIVPIIDSEHIYYNVNILSEGKPIRENSDLRYITASYCSKDMVNSILEYYQRK